MEKWRALSDEEQEKVIGRKSSTILSLMMTKPLTAHNVVSKAHDAEGNELKLCVQICLFESIQNEYGTFLLATHVNLVRHVKCLKICS